MVDNGWRIEMLGGLRVWRGESEVCRFRATKSGALLGYLALSAQRVHPREELIERFWPAASSPQVGRHNLRQELLALRKQLKIAASDAEPVFVGEHGHVELNRQVYVTDVAEMEVLLQTAARDATPMQRIAVLEKGIALYQGELLPGHYNDWVLDKRYYLAELYQQTLETIGLLWLEQDDFERATWYVLQTFIADPQQHSSRVHLEQLLRSLRSRPIQVKTGAEAQLRRLLERLQTLPNSGSNSSPDGQRQTRKLRRELSHWQQNLLARQPQQSHATLTNQTASAANQSGLSIPIRHFLPVPLTRLVGRATELDAIVAALSNENQPDSVRCLTIIGPGGIGKTRCAIAAAQRLKAQYRTVVFVPLADISDAQLLPQALATALHLRPANQAILETVVAHLQRQPALLVLDNVEHLADEAVPLLELLLRRVPNLRCLLTSRRLLSLAGERVYALAPLSLPVSGSVLADSESVELFVERARETQSDFMLTPRNVKQVNTLCAALEGVPLAIELVAARIAMLTLPEMIAGLENRLTLLDSADNSCHEREARHRSVSAALEWSLDLLPPEVRHFLLRLSVFQSGWTCQAASEVCSEPRARDYLERLRAYSLVASQLVTPAADDADFAENDASELASAPLELRFGMLETMRAYGQAQLSAVEHDAQAASHADFYAAFCEDVPSKYLGRGKALKIEQFDREYPNIRAALDYFYAPPEAADRAACHAKAVRMAQGLAPAYWFLRGFFREQRFWLERLLYEPEGELSQCAAIDVARAHYNLGVAAIMQTDWDCAAPTLDAALSQFRALDDGAYIGYTLNKIGVVAQARGQHERARELFLDSRDWCERASARGGVAHAFKCLGCLQIAQGEYEGVRELFTTALKIYRETQDPVAICMMLTELSALALRENRVDEAETLAQEALPLSRACRAPLHIAKALSLWGQIAQRRGDEVMATQFFAECEAVQRDLG